jgi:hypothetical protein
LSDGYRGRGRAVPAVPLMRLVSHQAAPGAGPGWPAAPGPGCDVAWGAAVAGARGWGQWRSGGGSGAGGRTRRLVAVCLPRRPLTGLRPSRVSHGYSGSPVTSFTRASLSGQPAPAAPACTVQVPPGDRRAMRKLTRVLEATMNGPSGTGSRRQASARPRLTMGLYDVTGGTTAIFHAGTAARSGNWGFRGNAVDVATGAVVTLAGDRSAVGSDERVSGAGGHE